LKIILYFKKELLLVIKWRGQQL